jgi:hypothetical protein
MKRNETGYRHARAALLVLGLVSAGCAPNGAVITDAHVHQFIAGTTTSEDVRLDLGRPSYRQVSTDGFAMGYVRHCPAQDICREEQAGGRWQHCEIHFSRADRYTGTSCLWDDYP